MEHKIPPSGNVPPSSDSQPVRDPQPPSEGSGTIVTSGNVSENVPQASHAATPDYSNFNSDDDEDSDEELEKVERFFSNQSTTAGEFKDAPEDNNDQSLIASEREYVAKLVSEDGIQGLSISRFEGWLGKDCLLQGKIFLTNRYLLFYAHLPPSTLVTLKASPLGKKSGRFPGKKYNRYWFVLRMGSFAWYKDPADMYFPTGIIPLNRMVSVAQQADSPEKFILKSCEGRLFTFKADSRNASHEWVKALQKEIFRARNNNTRPAAVVRIPLENIFMASKMTPLDIVDVINIQTIVTAKDPKNPERPLIDSYHFAFFGDKKTTQALLNRLASITNDFEHQSGVKYAILSLSHVDVDYANSAFGQITEDVYDTTPPTEFRLFEKRELTDDTEVPAKSEEDEVIVVGSKEGSVRPTPGESPGTLSPSTSGAATGTATPSTNTSTSRPKGPSRNSSRTGSSFLHSLLPTRSASRSTTPTHSESHSRSKLNILSTLNEKLHKLTAEDGGLKSDLSSIANAASMPVKLVPFVGDNNSSREASDREDEDDYDDESDSESSTGGGSGSGSSSSGNRSKSFDDKYMAYSPQNFGKKMNFGSGEHNNPITEEHNGVESETVHGQEDLDELNQWFRQRFGLEPGVSLLAEYICSLRKPGDQASWSGKLYIADHFLCFQRRNLVGGSNWRMVIPLHDIIYIREQPLTSTKLEFEVAETAYDEFRFTFSEAAGRRDAEELLHYVIKNIANSSQSDDSVQDNTLEQQNLDTDSESRFLEYSLRSARLSTYEPTVSSQLQQRIPPLLFDPTSSQYKEIFLRKPMKTLKFMMLMIGSRGDVQPYVALSQGLMEEGHKCCIVTHKEFKDWVESFGIEFREIAGDPRELMEIMISHGSISYGFVKEALAHFKGWLKDLMSTSWKALKNSDADVLIESPSSMIGIHIAEALNIPYFRAFTMPWTRTKAYPQALIAPDQKLGGGYNSFTYLMYDRLVWFGISKYVNRWRKRHLGLPETDLDSMRQEDVPFLYCVSPTVLVPPLDQPDWVHTCGYWELKENKDKDGSEDVDPKLVEFIDKSKKRNIPVVYIGFGSIIVTDPEAMTKTVIDATRGAGVNCVLARGWSGRSTKSKEEKKKEKEPLHEDHIFEVDSISHQWLFPQMDVCVHHGGSGTTGASLRCGKPTIIKPFFGDQFFYGRRVEDLGVGCNLKKLTTSGLQSALEECLGNKQMVRQATVLGEQIRHEHGVEEAILCIYRELVYAEHVTTRRIKLTQENAKSFTEKFSLLHPAESWLHLDKLKEHIEDGGEREDDDKSHSWFSLPKFGCREEQRQSRDSNDEIDVSV